MDIVRYRASVERVENFQILGKSRKHEVRIDEPYADDTAMSPIELLLNALGGCKVAISLEVAPKMGIKIDRISVDLVGTRKKGNPADGDESVYNGLTKIETTYHIESSASDEELKELIDFVDTSCPVGVTLHNGVPIESTLKRV